MSSDPPHIAEDEQPSSLSCSLSPDSSDAEEEESSSSLSPVPTRPRRDDDDDRKESAEIIDDPERGPLHVNEEEPPPSTTQEDAENDDDDASSSSPSAHVEAAPASPGDDRPDSTTDDTQQHAELRGIDPPPSRVTSPIRGDKDEVVSLEQRETAEEEEVQAKEIPIRPDEGESTAAPDVSEPPSSGGGDVTEKSTTPTVEQATMSPNMPSLQAEEKRDSSESLELKELLVDDEDVTADVTADVTKHQAQKEIEEQDGDARAMPPPPPRPPSIGVTSPLTSSPEVHPVYMAPGAMPLGLPMDPMASTQQTAAPFLPPLYGGAYQLAPMHQQPHHAVIPPPPPVYSSMGRRKIRLRLQQDQPQTPQTGHKRTPSFLFGRSFRNLNNSSQTSLVDAVASIDRGSVTVSWFEGTSSVELQEHVRKCVVRKMGLSRNVKLADMRIMDESVDPPEEIVLSTYIPDGSEFLLRFSTREAAPAPAPMSFFRSDYSGAGSAPLSPSAAPASPHPSASDLAGLNAAQLSLLGAHLQGMNGAHPRGVPKTVHPKKEDAHEQESLDGEEEGTKKELFKSVNDPDGASKASTDFAEEEVLSMRPEDQIEARLRQLTDLLTDDKSEKRQRRQRRRQEKKQVIFVLANYFVLFLSLIAISAEIQARAPRWMAWMERNLESVQTCATDQDSLFDCVSKGKFSGLIASFILWFGRSAATKRFFLFGFETPKRLWTVVYEALITALCWGISYMFIRRGMNPDTRQNFLQRYWKDAVYGSLAGFNASFLKAVLKNLIPQEALEDALQDRHIKILSWLPSFNN